MSSKRLKILLIRRLISQPSVRGSMRYLVNLYKYLSEEKDFTDEVEVKLTEISPLIKKIKGRDGLDDLKEFNPDLVLTEYGLINASLYQFTKSLNIPLGMILHEKLIPRSQIYKYSDFIIPNSKTLESWVLEDKKRDIPCFTLYPPFIPFNLKSHSPDFITLPSNNFHKGGKEFIKLVDYCKDSLGKKFLSVQGLPPRNNYFISTDYGENWPIQEDFSKVLERTAILVHLSLFESFGYAWVEGAWEGIPTVGIDTDGSREFELSKWGIVISDKDKDNLEKWREAFKTVLAEYEYWSNKAKSWARNSKKLKSKENIKEFIDWAKKNLV